MWRCQADGKAADATLPPIEEKEGAAQGAARGGRHTTSHQKVAKEGKSPYFREIQVGEI